MLRIILPALALGVDRVTKHLTRKDDLHGIYCRGNISLEHVENDGLAAGIGSGHKKAVRLAHSAALAGLTALLLPTLPRSSRLRQCGVALLLSGAASNLYDRLRHGTVTDMLRFPKAPGKLSTLVWNAADLMLLAGLVLTTLGSFRKQRT